MLLSKKRDCEVILFLFINILMFPQIKKIIRIIFYKINLKLKVIDKLQTFCNLPLSLCSRKEGCLGLTLNNLSCFWILLSNCLSFWEIIFSFFVKAGLKIIFFIILRKTDQYYLFQWHCLFLLVLFYMLVQFWKKPDKLDNPCL